MSFKKRVIPALVASALILGAPSAQAIQFSGVYIFGDSLSDAGFYRPGLVALLGSTAAAGVGRFTSNPGPVWSELIAQYYGGNAAPSNAGGGIYAQGGMQVTGNAPASRVGPGGTQRSMATQVSEYLASSGGSANPNALYGVWLGANDIFTLLEGLQTGAVTAAQLPTILPAIAAAEVGQIARLQAAGARYILVFNIPAIGATPAFAGNASLRVLLLVWSPAAKLLSKFLPCTPILKRRTSLRHCAMPRGAPKKSSCRWLLHDVAFAYRHEPLALMGGGITHGWL